MELWNQENFNILGVKMDKQKVIIIGAGPAGLTAAYELLRKTDIKPIILEESDTVGGISKTKVYKNNRMDLGGHRFFTKNEEVLNIWKELMPLQGSPSKDDIVLNREQEWSHGGPDPEKEDKVFLIRNRISRIYFLRKFFEYPISLKIETFKNMGLKRTLHVGIGYLISSVNKRSENSLEEFYINRFGKPLYEMFFEDYTEKLWGVHPSEIAPDWGSQRVKGLSLLKLVTSVFKKPFIGDNKIETSLIEQFYYPKYGPGQLWEIMADEIIKMGGDIVFDTQVKKLKFSNSYVVVEALNHNNEAFKFSSDFVFSSMPIKDLINSIEDGPTDEVRQIASELPYRDFITVGLLLNKLLIKNTTKLKTISNIVPDCWIYMQEREVKLGRIQIFNNWSPYMVDKLDDTVWIGLEYFCNENDKMWNMSNEEFIQFAIDELQKIKIINKEDVLDYTVIKVKKAYPAYFGTYKDFNIVKEYLNSIDNLYCIGRNGQHRYNNMDHSMLTAIEAVNCLINGTNEKGKIWNVNTEEDYHEAKSS